jgi:hypothetical protein
VEHRDYRNKVRLAISQLAKTIKLLQNTHGLTNSEVFRIIMTAWRDAGDRECSIRLAWFIEELEIDEAARKLNLTRPGDRRFTKKNQKPK